MIGVVLAFLTEFLNSIISLNISAIYPYLVINMLFLHSSSSSSPPLPASTYLCSPLSLRC